eukprot:scaffold35405_cov39-Prasinocladus_malaysianus.AAC.1
MSDSAGQQQPDQAQQQLEQFPPPPGFYKLYDPGAESDESLPLPPGPPVPIEGEYEQYGELHTVRRPPNTHSLICLLCFRSFANDIKAFSRGLVLPVSAPNLFPALWCQ